jgi:acyl-CoA thioester hydrolase
MSIVHSSHFVVREYECDAYGHLNQANYARYMQESALAASAAVGYSRARYEALNRLWLARRTEIEYLQPLYYDDTVTIKTWVADFRQVRSLRRYEFFREGVLVARAATDWVYLVRDSGMLISPSEELIAAYNGDDTLISLPRETFPAPPPAPVGAFTLRKRVEWRDIDSLHHLNNAAYFNYLEDCAREVSRQLGWPSNRLLAAKIAMVIRRQLIDYKLPVPLDDEVDISTWLYDVRRFSAMRYYKLTRVSDGAMIAQAQAQWVSVNTETGKPIRVPEQMLADFAPNIVSEKTSADSPAY